MMHREYVISTTRALPCRLISDPFQSFPIKGLALLFFHEEEADSSEERYVEQISLLLSVNPNDTIQEPLRLGSNEIRPKPVINRMLFDETVNGATVRGEIVGVSISGFEEPEQIVGEFSRHVVDVNPERKRQRVERIQIESIHFGVKNGVVEVIGGVMVVLILRSVVGEGGWSVGEEVVERSDE